MTEAALSQTRDAGAARGLFRDAVAGPGRRVEDVFEHLGRHRNSRVVAEHPDRGALAARLDLDRSEGHGSWDFYRLDAGDRDASVSVYCSLAYLRSLLDRNGLAAPVWFEPAAASDVAVRHTILPLSVGLMYVARSLLRNPFEGGLRILHAEAKVLELLCEVFQLSCEAPAAASQARDDELRRLDLARRIVTTQFSPAPQIGEVAKRVGMSETKLKRAFKARFGNTLFDTSVDARMRHALELLRCKRMSVGQVAYAVGYSHQTSFTSAFKQHFGFLPRAARQQIG